jgi:hypothetical protein
VNRSGTSPDNIKGSYVIYVCVTVMNTIEGMLKIDHQLDLLVVLLHLKSANLLALGKVNPYAIIYPTPEV